jgi:hypothetical protein
LQVLAAFEVIWTYFLPSVIFIICYGRIAMVVRHRQSRINCITVSPVDKRNADTVVDDAVLETKPQNIHRNDTSNDTSRKAAVTVNARAIRTAPEVSSKHVNILQTMILITASFIILWMPTILTILLVHFQVGFFLLPYAWRKI